MKVVHMPVMKRSDERIYLALITLVCYLTALFAIWWFWPLNIPHNSVRFHVLDIFLFLVVTYVVWHQIIMQLFSLYVGLFMKRPLHIHPRARMRVAFLTAFVPANEPLDILENTLRSMVKADYPHDTWVLDEGNSDKVKELCTRLNVNHFSRKGVTYYNSPAGRYRAKTKGGNYNAWFDEYGSQYDLVAQIDVDFVPKRNFLTRTIGYFRDPDVGFVGTPQIYGNQDSSWIARGAAEQAFSFYGHVQKGLSHFDMSLFIGANHVLRTKAHEDIDGYSGHITEDHLTGMNIYKKKWKSVYVPESLAVGEGPTTWESYFSQQMRWAYGLFHILFNESAVQFKEMKKIHVFNYFILQQFYFYGLAQCAGIVLMSLYFIFGIQATNLPIQALVFIYTPMLIVQFLSEMWLQKYRINPAEESGIHLRGIVLSIAAWPIYFLAFLSVLTGRRLNYVVTPKGEKMQSYPSSLRLFIPHFIFGTITLIDVIVGLAFHHTAPQLMYFAIINTILMYMFIGIVLFEKAKHELIHFEIPLLRLARG